jgi:hypothetical protein
MVTATSKKESASNRGNTAEEVVPCPSGMVVLGGGGNVSTAGGAVGALVSSYPSAANAWTAAAVTTTGKAGGEIGVTVYAICGAP